MFYDILERENAFLGYKNKKFKSQKIDIFPKGVNPWFLSKNHHFSNFSFSGNIGLQNLFCDILQRKNAILGYKNKKFKEAKNWHFSKEVNPYFWSKDGHFLHLFFVGNIGQENVFLRYSRTKNQFPRL